MTLIPNKTQTAWFLKTLQSIKSKPCEQGFSLPGAFYTDPLWAQTESRELFTRDWFCVGRAEAIEE